jgi:hypothetical protein
MIMTHLSEATEKTQVMVGVPAKIRTEHLLNTNKERFRYPSHFDTISCMCDCGRGVAW